jgi:hypothetical protein
MVRRVIWTRSRIRTLLIKKGFLRFKTLRYNGFTKGYNEFNECVIRISNFFIEFNASYEINIPINEIHNMKISKDYPYMNILIFTKNNEMLEFHVPYYKEENEE